VDLNGMMIFRLPGVIFSACSVFVLWRSELELSWDMGVCAPIQKAVGADRPPNASHFRWQRYEVLVCLLIAGATD
jgi:hypothetical protein